MYVAYVAQFDTAWSHEKSDIASSHTTLERWLETMAETALRQRRKVWLCWPYYIPQHAETLLQAIQQIRDHLIDEGIMRHPSLALRAVLLARRLFVPVKSDVVPVEQARCVVFYAESSI